MGNATALENGTALALNLKRSKTVLRPDPSRVLLRQFEPGDARRIIGIVERIMAVPEAMVGRLLDQVSESFAQRHLQLQQRFMDRFEQLRELMPAHAEFSTQRKLLIGAYFLAEYALESAALFSPSMVQHPNQTGLPEGAVRFILSLRATGEGHISSITFRSGIIHRDLRIEVDPAGRLLTEPRQIANTVYQRPLFQRKLCELGLESDFTNRVLARLGDSFGLTTLRDALNAELEHSGQAHGEAGEDQLRAQSIWMLARSNYEVQFKEEQDLSERIIFPSTPSQKNGIEDARFVRFRKDDGSHVYFATFTAYDGRVIMPELLETSDFLRFRFISLNGPEAENKGMASVSTESEWGLCNDLSPGQREYFPDAFGQCALLERTSVTAEAPVSVGAGADWKLRIAHRDRGGMVGAESRSGTDAAVLHWCFPAGSEGSVKSPGAAARTDDDSGGERARRVCAECGLFVWGVAAPGAVDYSLWAGGSCQWLCHGSSG